MSGTGRVLDVFGASVPNTNRPARMVLVEREGGEWVKFGIAPGNDPPKGCPISWGPHHAWWPGSKVDKLTWEMPPST